MGLLAVELIPDYSDALAPRGHIRVGGQGTAHSALPAGRVSPQATVKNPALTLPHIEPHTVERAIVGDGQTWTVVRAGIDRWAIDACRHHGRGLAVADAGTLHSVWVNVREGEGRVCYGGLRADAPIGQRSVGGY